MSEPRAELITTDMDDWVVIENGGPDIVRVGTKAEHEAGTAERILPGMSKIRSRRLFADNYGVAEQFSPAEHLIEIGRWIAKTERDIDLLQEMLDEANRKIAYLESRLNSRDDYAQEQRDQS